VAALGVVAVAAGTLVALALGGSGKDPAEVRSTPAKTTTVVNRAPAKPRTTTQQAPAPATDAGTLNDQGFALMGQGRYGEAIAPLQQAVTACGSSNAIDPCGYALYNLGRTLRLAGHPAEAIPFLERRLLIPNQTGAVRKELRAAQREAGQKPGKGPKGPKGD
jgi:serine/threonine-protein kinase